MVARYMKVVKELGLRPNSVFGVKKHLGAKKAPARVLTFTDKSSPNDAGKE